MVKENFEAPNSDRKVDYKSLEDLLKDKRWEEANKRTRELMNQVVHYGTNAGYLGSESIKTFSCQDLGIVDHLWAKYSNSLFSFSTQQRIWQSLESNVEAEKECLLGDRVGWRINGEFVNSNRLYFTLQALPGHLPYLGELLGTPGMGFP
ncbi:MAG: GUN4 domain-containing protein [Myxacorys californica WJT36-NPBG1]|jgi:hypothetical protein|nr:GUN4 domain-containing protein [Myxacorys californica WJT36-NPBG1]